MRPSVGDGPEVFSAARFHRRQAAMSVATAVGLALLARGFGATLWIGLGLVAGSVIGSRAAMHRVVVLDQVGARLPSTGLIPWAHIDGVEVTEPQSARWMRPRPRSGLQLRLGSLPDGWVRIRGTAPSVEIPIVDDEEGLRRAIDRRRLSASRAADRP